MIRLADVSYVRVVDREQLTNEIGWGARIGAGGLWGAFGWLWTKRRGLVQMYVSRTRDFVWVERVDGRPWLITPEKPEEFARALTLACVNQAIDPDASSARGGGPR